MSENISESSISKLISDIWLQFANPDTLTVQFHCFISILDEIESRFCVEKYSILPLEIRNEISNDIQINGNQLLSLNQFDAYYESYANNSLISVMENAIENSKITSFQNENEAISIGDISEKHTLVSSNKTDSDVITPASLIHIPNETSSTTKHCITPESMNITQPHPSSDSFSPLSVTKVRSFSKRKPESKWEIGKRRSFSSITLTPRSYNHHEDEENDEELRREMTQLIDGDNDVPIYSPARSRVASTSSFRFYSNDNGSLASLNENDDDSLNSIETSTSRRGSRKFLGNKRSMKDIRTISQLNEHILFLEDSLKKQEQELKEKRVVITILERKCRNYDRRVCELEEADLARARQIDEVENVVKMTQQELKNRRQHESRASEVFTSTITQLRKLSFVEEVNRRKSTDGIGLRNRLENEYNNYDKPSTRNRDTNQNLNGKNSLFRPGTAPVNATEGFNLTDTHIQRPASEGSAKPFKKGHRPSSSSVFSVSPEETAADYDEKVEELELDVNTTTYLKELFRSSQQKVINIVYNQLNELKDLNSKLNEAETKSQHLVVCNEKLTNDYQIRLQQIEEFEHQIEEKYKSDSQNEIHRQVKEQISRIKETNEKEREEERRAFEALLQKQLKHQIQQVTDENLHQVHQLKLQIENHQQIQQELELRLKDKDDDNDNRFRYGDIGMRSLEDELQGFDDESELHSITPAISNISTSAISHSASFILPTDDEGNLDLDTFVEKMLKPVAQEQGVRLTSIEELRNYKNTTIENKPETLFSNEKSELPNQVGLSDNKGDDNDEALSKRAFDSVDFLLNRKSVYTHSRSQSQTLSDILRPFSASASITGHGHKKSGSVPLIETAKYKVNSPKPISSQKAPESMKRQQKYQIKENIKYHVEPDNNFIGNISERNTTHYFNQLLNRKLFIYIYIVISFFMLVIFTCKVAGYGISWFGNNNSEISFHDTSKTLGSSSLPSSLCQVSTNSRGACINSANNRNMWWSYLPGYLKNFGSFIDQFARSYNAPPV